MTPLACLLPRARLPLLVGGELPRRRVESVRAHLDGCAACSEEYARLVWARRALRRAAAGTPAADEAMFDALHQDVMARVVRAEARPRPRRWAGGLAAAALFAVGFLMVPRPASLVDRESIPFPSGRAVGGATDAEVRPMAGASGYRPGSGVHPLARRSRTPESDGAVDEARLDRLLEAFERRMAERGPVARDR